MAFISRRSSFMLAALYRSLIKSQTQSCTAKSLTITCCSHIHRAHVSNFPCHFFVSSRRSSTAILVPLNFWLDYAFPWIWTWHSLALMLLELLGFWPRRARSESGQVLTCGGFGYELHYPKTYKSSIYCLKEPKIETKERGYIWSSERVSLVLHHVSTSIISASTSMMDVKNEGSRP